jgi:paraquat-inducible protein B
MRRRANALLIGLFVVGALFLAVIVVAVLGSGWFRWEKTYVLYFQGSVMGLGKGSPVTFKGVRVGSVSNIAIRFNPTTLAFFVPVYIDVDPSKLQAYDSNVSGRAYDMAPLTKKGLRGQLQMQSYVTGQLVVALDFFPGTPENLVGLEKGYPEIPTIPSRTEEISKTLGQLPLNELTQALLQAVRSIDRVVNAPGIARGMDSLNATLAEISGLARTIQREIGPLATNLKNISQSTQATLSRAQTSFQEAQLKETMATVRSMMNEAEKTLGTARRNLSEGSPIMHDLEATLRDLAASARSIRATADYVEQHPEALIRGKRGK